MPGAVVPHTEVYIELHTEVYCTLRYTICHPHARGMLTSASEQSKRATRTDEVSAPTPQRWSPSRI